VAEAAFTAIGLPVTATVLNASRARLKGDPGVSTQRFIQELERALSEIDEPVDLALERFAKRTTRAE
jgi:hypothetical protein